MKFLWRRESLEDKRSRPDGEGFWNVKLLGYFSSLLLGVNPENRAKSSWVQPQMGVVGWAEIQVFPCKMWF